MMRMAVWEINCGLVNRSYTLHHSMENTPFLLGGLGDIHQLYICIECF